MMKPRTGNFKCHKKLKVPNTVCCFTILNQLRKSCVSSLLREIKLKLISAGHFRTVPVFYLAVISTKYWLIHGLNDSETDYSLQEWTMMNYSKSDLADISLLSVEELFGTEVTSGSYFWLTVSPDLCDLLSSLMCIILGFRGASVSPFWSYNFLVPHCNYQRREMPKTIPLACLMCSRSRTALEAITSTANLLWSRI